MNNPARIKIRVILVILITFFVTNVGYAQWYFDSGINEGYEWNIFKNPQRLVESNDTLNRKQLWQNSAYNNIFVESDYYKDWGDQRLKVSADISTNFYHQQAQANKYDYQGLVSYRTNYADNMYFEIDPEFSRKQQDGVDRTDLVFSTRLSYIQFELPLHFDFYLGDKRWLKFETRYRFKQYDKFEDRQTSYQAYYGIAEFKKSWDNRSGLNHEFEILNETRYRDQITTDFEEQDEENKFRQFLKIENGMHYSLETTNESFELEIPFQFTLLYDYPSNSLNYQEFEFGTELTYRFAQVEFNAVIERTIRDFNNFSVSNDQNTLQYGYWTSFADVEVQLTRNMFLVIEGQFISRRSNRERLTTAFYREYKTSYLQSGIMFEF